MKYLQSSSAYLLEEKEVQYVGVSAISDTSVSQ